MIACDSQRIKESALAGLEDEEGERRRAIMGVLRLYPDFVKLFLLLLADLRSPKVGVGRRSAPVFTMLLG